MKTCDGVEFTLERCSYYFILSNKKVVLTPQSELREIKLHVCHAKSITVVDIRWLATVPNYAPTPTQVLQLFKQRPSGTCHAGFYGIRVMEYSESWDKVLKILQSILHQIFYDAAF